MLYFRCDNRPAKPNTLYALGAFTNVIFKSTNGGANWKAAGSLGPGTTQGPLTIDPHTSTLYTPPISRVGGGMLKSADGGASWSAVYFTLRDSRVPSLAIDPKSPGTVYAGASKSTDAGMSWYPANISFGGSVNALAIDPQTPSTVYA